jgi:hypothetical protein
MPMNNTLLGGGRPGEERERERERERETRRESFIRNKEEKEGRVKAKNA